jgi:TonB family protein
MTPTADSVPVAATPSPSPAPSPVVDDKPVAGKTPGRKLHVIDVVPPGAGPGDWLLPGPGVEPPVPLALPSYEYPAAARGTGRKVTVRLSVLVDENGKVIDARVREGDDFGLGFNEVALEAARRAVYQPATRDDVPGKMWTELMLDFAD